ncbi:MAG: PadR family transcriptional regulator [Propionibacteriales bacterium]|nr:PadR family transcriptional regulator [Propionibacteriales bacterium]
MPNEAELQQFVSTVTQGWAETHKKGALAPLILLGLSRGPAWTQQILDWMHRVSSGHLDMDIQSLHRAMRRLEQLGAVTVNREPAAGTGARRKFYELTDVGELLLRRHLDTTLSYLWHPDFLAAKNAAAGPDQDD